MNRMIKSFDAVKNIQKAALPRDFRLNALSLIVLALFLGGGLFWQYAVAPPPVSIELVKLVSGALASALLLALLPVWGLGLVLIASFWISLLAYLGLELAPLTLMISLGLFMAPCLQIAHHWEKAVILRLGKFRKLKGPGIFLLLPLLDRVTRFVDTRIRVTDFSAEKTITMDTVPVHVDALAFWMIWDPRKAILEVENFLEAVVLSAQTALRDAIGKHELAELLSERERLGRQIQEILEKKTNPWGITILSIEIKDIIIPRELEDAMSKRAQAERERQSRVILGTAEIEISDKFVEAAERYKDNPTALRLRGMNMIYEGIKKHGTVVLLPSSGLAPMSLGGMVNDLIRGGMPPDAGPGDASPGAENTPAENRDAKEQSDD
jgi:hypothetical protein